MEVYRLTQACSVAPQIRPSDVETLKQNGYVTVVCNRPDGEQVGQPTAASVAAECQRLGVVFHNLPISRDGITGEMVEQFQKIVAESNGLVLSYCHSGHRSSVLWQSAGSP